MPRLQLLGRIGLRFCLTLGLLLVPGLGSAQGLLPVPTLSGHVIDQTATLDGGQVQMLEEKLALFERDKGTQIVILLVSTTAPEDMASFANRVGNRWKIGRKDIGDGVLLIVAKADRRVRIEVAKTLEGAIPDLAAQQVIDDAITPNFKAGNFSAGLVAAVGQITALITGEALPAPKARKAPTFGAGEFQWTDLAIFMFFAVPIAGGVARSIFGRKLGAVLVGGGVGVLALLVTTSLLVAGAAAVVALVVTLLAGTGLGQRDNSRWGTGGLGGSGGMAGRGGFGGSSGNGGFSSGGGGDFGGGGASGSW